MEDARDLLLADLEHFGEALFQNENIGEKRFSFFVTLVAAVAAGLVTLATNPGLEPADVRKVASAAVGFLLIVGLLTYLRMLQRNRVTDEYQRTLGYIRQRLAHGDPALAAYRVPVSLGRHNSSIWWNVLKGGYAQTIAVLNGILAAVLIYLLAGVAVPIALAVGGVAVFLLLIPGSRRSKEVHGAAQSFRANAGAVIVNDAGLVLAFERMDVAGAWQLPQGGLASGEEPEHAVYREVSEETSIAADQLELLDRYPTPLAYELPREHRSEKTGRGQVQYWFLFRVKPGVTVGRPESRAEFRASRWCRFEELKEGAAPFRQAVYAALQERFSQHLA